MKDHRSRYYRYLSGVLGVTCLAPGAWAQVGAAPKPAAAPPLISGSIRTREEVWDWFTPAQSGYSHRYSFNQTILRVAAQKKFGQVDTKLELAAPSLWGLPKNAVAPAPQGILGLGGLYRAANGSRNGSIFIKQLYAGIPFGKTQSLRAGRFEFAEGAETVPGNPDLAWVKKQRVAERLIGPFAWTLVGRSLDGLHYTYNRPTLNVTAVAAYPTQGVFDLHGATALTAVRVAYLGATFPDYKKKTGSVGEERLFGIFYADTRDIAKTDNSTVKDRDAIKITTFGGHVLRGGAIGSGSWDGLLWGAYQFGKWGQKDQSAYAYTGEAGYKFGAKDAAPWFRLGYYYASGDGNAGDGKHGTFYAPLSTPRIYARTPVYTESNIKDLFAQILWKPQARVALRTDYHRLDLANSKDLWYVADGPFQTRPYFGLFGRPANGKNPLADLADLSVDFTASPKDAITLYYGYMMGRDVVRAIYPNDTRGSFAYAEYTRKF